jgi:hypothetical protein
VIIIRAGVITDSKAPRRARMAIICVGVRTAAVQQRTMPQHAMLPPRTFETGNLWMRNPRGCQCGYFDQEVRLRPCGNSARVYARKNAVAPHENWFPCIPMSFCIPITFAY